MATGTAKSASWTLIGSATGSTAVTLPAAFSELIVEARYGTSAIHFNVFLCKAQRLLCRHDAKLLTLFVDDANLSFADFLINQQFGCDVHTPPQ